MTPNFLNFQVFVTLRACTITPSRRRPLTDVILAISFLVDLYSFRKGLAAQALSVDDPSSIAS